MAKKAVKKEGKKESVEVRDDVPVVAGNRFKVRLECPTPLLHHEAEVSADDEALAWKAFCELNGISGSEHPRTIERV
jgi:hypothetical protein